MKVKRLNEAHYGGAFDIADDQYFTREDVDNAAEKVLDHISETFKGEYHIGGSWVENGKFIVNIQDNDYNEYEATVVVDMRKIKRPSDLADKYALNVASEIIKQIKENTNVNESFTMYSISNREHEQEVDKLIREYQAQGWNPWDSRYSGSKYYVILARRGEDGKGEFKAIQYSNQLFPRVIDITYKQAQGYEPIDDFDGLRRELGRKLLPQREGLTEASDIMYVVSPTRGDSYKTFTSKDKVLSFLEDNVGYNVFEVSAKEFKSLVKAAKEANRPNPTKFAFNRLHSEKKTKAFNEDWKPGLTDCPECGDTSFDSKKGKCTKCNYREGLKEGTFTDKIAKFKKAFDFGVEGYKAGLKVGGAHNEEFLQWMSSLNLPLGSKEQLRLLDEYNKGWMKANLDNWDEEKGEEKYSVGSGKKIAVEPIDEDVRLAPTDLKGARKTYDVSALEKDILTVENVVDVDFDLDMYEELSQVILLTKYSIPFNDNAWHAKRKQIKKDVIKVAKKHGLVWSGDAIEDYGDWLYFVFDEPMTKNEAWSYEPTYDKNDGWTDADIELHKATDWKARNYAELPVPEDSFMHTAVAHTDEGTKRKSCKFTKYIRANSIFPPYYKPETKPFEDVVGPMYDGEDHNGYGIHNRYESQEVYDALFDSWKRDGKKLSEGLEDRRVSEEFLERACVIALQALINDGVEFPTGRYSVDGWQEWIEEIRMGCPGGFILEDAECIRDFLEANGKFEDELEYIEMMIGKFVKYHPIDEAFSGDYASIEDESNDKLHNGSSEEMSNIIYDTLFQNTQYPQFNFEECDDFEVDARKNIISFNYRGHRYQVKVSLLEKLGYNIKTLKEGKQGFIKNHGDCRILYVGSTYVVTDNKGLNIGESPTMDGAEAIADEHSKKPIKEDIDEGHEVYGSWSVDFTITLEGEEVRFDDLSEVSQEHIANLIGEGYVCGEVFEYDSETDDQTSGWWSISRELYLDDEGDIQWDGLDECSQEHIADMIKDGYTSGELCVWREADNLSEAKTPNKKVSLYINGEYICSSNQYTSCKEFVDKVKADGKIEYQGHDGEKLGKIVREIKDTDKVTARFGGSMKEAVALTEAPVIKLSDDDIMTPHSIDFKKKIADATAEEEAEKARQDKENRKAEITTKYSEVFSKVRDALEGDTLPSDILFDAFYDGIIVPDKGKCDSVGGELIRAIGRILGRSYNDGDKFYQGYGLETCGGSAQYLADHGFDKEIYAIIANADRYELDDDLYDKDIEALARKVMLYVLDNADLFSDENTDDSRDYSYEAIENEQPRYEWTITASDDVERLLDNRDVDAWDLSEYVEGVLSWDSSYDGAEVDRPFSTYYGEITVSNLTIDGRNALSGATKNLDSFWADFVDDHRDELNALDNEDNEYDDDFEDED